MNRSIWIVFFTLGVKIRKSGKNLGRIKEGAINRPFFLIEFNSYEIDELRTIFLPII
jgi:hypothetical protein